MVQTYSNYELIYSVDMMFTYIYLNKTKIKVKKYPVNTLLENLTFPGWGDPVLDIKYSPNDVLENPDKYINDYKRIINADLSYPIIIDENDNIIDGIHRLTKAILENKRTIKCYVFSDKLMKKFIIAKDGNWEYVDKLKSYQLMILYIERFIKRNKK
jgi:hypothetical protein